jgi:hypothetical protein
MRLSLCAFFVVLAGQASAAPSPDADIRASFERYKAAAIANNGAAAAAELDDNTAHYYDQMRTAALTAPDIHGMPVMDKLIVLRLRLELTPDHLSSMDGRALIAFAIGKRWVNAAQVGMGTLGKIKVAGTRAEAEVVVKGQPTPMKLVFRKNKPGWRLDLTANNATTATALEAMRKKAGISEDEMVTEMVKEVIHRPVPEAAWRPLMPASPRR